MGLDARKLLILSILVEEYIKTGEPVGSKNILTASGLSVSSATVRNDMAILEKRGLIEKPYTSAGRVPTPLGYRLYIEKLMQPQPLSLQEQAEMHHLLSEINAIAAQNLLEQATKILSEFTQLMVINANQTVRFSVITKVEVIAAGKRVYLLLLITSSGEIKNKACRLEWELTKAQLDYFAEIINNNLQGNMVDALTPAMLQNLEVALGSDGVLLFPLLAIVFELGAEFSSDQLHIHGKERLVCMQELDSTALEQILNGNQQRSNLLCRSVGDITVIFGEDHEMLAETNLSFIVSHYHINQVQGGTFGVIGPLRVDYAKVIPYTQCFSTCITALLADMMDEGTDVLL